MSMYCRDCPRVIEEDDTNLCPECKAKADKPQMNADERRFQQMVDSWFGAKHVATKTHYLAPDGGLVTAIRWGEPGSSIYAVHYLFWRSLLFVCGDVGEATYQWSSDVTPDWVASLDLSYFASKCQASPYGRGYETWDSAVAGSVVFRWLSDVSPAKRHLFSQYGGKEALYSRQEWIMWLDRHGSQIWTDFTEMGNPGRIISLQCRGHLTGLKLAMAELNNRHSSAAIGGSSSSVPSV